MRPHVERHLLSESCLIEPHYNDGTLCIEVYAILQTELSPLRLIHVTTSELPAVNGSLRCSFHVPEVSICGRSGVRSGHAMTMLPFSASSDLSMFAMMLTLGDPWIDSESYAVYMFCLPFLSAVEAVNSQIHDPLHKATVVEWQDWGPQSTFWFTCSSVTNKHAPRQVYGYRTITDQYILYFNPLDIPCCTYQKSDIVHGTYVNQSSFLTIPIKTVKSFRRILLNGVLSPQPGLEYLHDEEIVTFKVCSLSYLRKQSYSCDMYQELEGPDSEIPSGPITFNVTEAGGEECPTYDSI